MTMPTPSSETERHARSQGAAPGYGALVQATPSAGSGMERAERSGGLPLDSIICGDALEVMKRLPSESVDLIVTSPPYNCRKNYGVFSDEMPWPEYYAWIGKILDECYRMLVVGGTIAVNVPGVVRWQSQHAHAHTWADYDAEYPTKRDGVDVKGKGRCEPVGMRLWQMMFDRDTHMREPVMWPKGSEDNAIATSYQMGCDSDPHIRPAHEWILLGSKARWYHRGGTGRRGPEAMPWLDETKDVWFMSPVSRDDHPAPFPIELPRRLIRLFGHAKDCVVMDPFTGTGTTCLAAKEMHKRYVGIELSSIYAAIARGALAQDFLFLGGGGAERLGDTPPAAEKRHNNGTQRPPTIGIQTTEDSGHV